MGWGGGVRGRVLRRFFIYLLLTLTGTSFNIIVLGQYISKPKPQPSHGYGDGDGSGFGNKDGYGDGYSSTNTPYQGKYLSITLKN